MRWRRLGWASVLVLGLVGVAQWWASSPPIAMLAASYVAMLGLLSRALPVRVAVSAALLAQQAALLAVVLVLPLAVGGPLRPGVALAVLALPCLAVVPDILVRRADVDPPLRVRLGVLAAAGTGGLVLVVVALLAGRTDPFGVFAWSTSGDARYHLLFARMVLAEGGLHGTPLTFQPEYQEALTALLLDTHGRGALAPGPLLEHDLRGLGQVSLTLGVLWTLATSAALFGLGPLRARGAVVVVLAASLLPLTGLGLGVLLRDGFLPILLVVPLLLAGLTVLSWLHTTELTGTPVSVAVGVSAAAVPLLAFTWTPYAVVLGAACVVPWWRALRAGEQRILRLVMMIAGTSAGAAYTVVVLHQAHDFVEIPGSITEPSVLVAAGVPLLVLALRLLLGSGVRTSALVPYLVGTVATAGIVAYAAAAQPDGQALWSYFPSKVAWIWVLVGVPFLLVPFAHPRTGATRRPVVAVLGAGAVLGGVVWASPTPSPLRALDDWTQPDTDALHLAVDLGHPQERYVVYRVDPAQDRLTNFWLAAHDPYDGPTDEDDFILWGYRHPAGTAADICTLLELQPFRVVATADPRRKNELRRTCGRDVPIRVIAD